ncbi:MAG: SGNH/GDSL hydrolase family protein, partial [Oscillospiraceae bacterium]
TVQTTQPQHREETREAEPTEETEYQLCDCVIPYGDHYLSDEEKSFIGQSIFVGDSICLGFGSYGRVPKERVIARGSLGAWSFFDYDFSYKNKDCSYDYVLKKIKPKYVFLSMGMNDVNITNADMYCVNYSKIIDITLKETDARIFVCAINPVDSDFTSNERIDQFNSAMRDYVKEHYTGRVECIDYGRLFRCADGKKLCGQLSGGDGIHLAPYAYDMALWEIHNVLSYSAVQPTDEHSAETGTAEQD